MSDTETEPEESSVIFDWVMSQMLRLGVPYEDAEHLTESGADWHDVDRLLRAGCPPQMVAGILG